MTGWNRIAAALACGLIGLASRADAPLAPQVAVLAPMVATGQTFDTRLAVGPVKLGMLLGEDLGHISQGSWLCSVPRTVLLTPDASRTLVAQVTLVATQELKRLGYPLAGLTSASAFDTDVSSAPDFRLGAVLRGYREEICIFSGKAEGWIHFRVDWALFSEKEQKVVFQRSTEGLAQSSSKVPDLSQRALVVAIDNFLAAPEVLEALRRTGPGAGSSPGVTPVATLEAPVGQHGLTLARTQPQPGGTQKNQDRLRAAVVVVETTAGSGSGFYVDREGYLLTDYHVVKGSKYVKVKLSNGDKMVAQVIKASERDDVALLKTPAVDLEPLAIRETPLDVGAEVYAIGAPLGVLTSTLTRGVLSADRVLQGTHLLQSDVAVTFGSSGGPLLDGEGRVVGLTKAGIAEGRGFNFFIPIQDALRVLGIDLGGGRSEAIAPAEGARQQVAMPATAPAQMPATAAALAITPNMLTGHTWIYPHPRDPARLGNVELTFAAPNQVSARTAVSNSTGSYVIQGDTLCVSFVAPGWGRVCYRLIESEGEKKLLFAASGKVVSLTVR
ncbi:S1C family serine protease [Burkholderiaceae bacterium UC74_6]